MSYGPQTRNPWEHDESAPETTQNARINHRGREFYGCHCADCEDTRERLRVSLAAMAMHGPDAEVCRCDHCDHWMCDGDPDNGRIGTAYVCQSCYAKSPIVAAGRMRERRRDEQRDDQ